VAKIMNGEVNKSAAIRDLYKHDPDVQVKDVISSLASKGIKVAPNLVYLVKGQMKGEKNRRKTVTRNATKVAEASGSHDAVATIVKIKSLASEVGGLRTLKSLVDALSD